MSKPIGEAVIRINSGAEKVASIRIVNEYSSHLSIRLIHYKKYV
jgi:hypothetical protein